MSKLRIESVYQSVQKNYASAPSVNLYKDRLSLQAEFDVLSSNEVEDLFLKVKHSYYEYSDKASKLLAHQLRQASSSQIPQIHTLCNLTTDPLKINDHVKQFYSFL